MGTRSDWTIEELQNLHSKPLLELVMGAMETHKEHHKIGEIQVCHLISMAHSTMKCNKKIKIKLV